MRPYNPHDRTNDFFVFHINKEINAGCTLKIMGQKYILRLLDYCNFQKYCLSKRHLYDMQFGDVVCVKNANCYKPCDFTYWSAVQPQKKKQGFCARGSQGPSGQSTIQAENTLQTPSSVNSAQFSEDKTKISIIQSPFIKLYIISAI